MSPSTDAHRRASVADAIRAAFADDSHPPPPPVIRADKRHDGFYRSLEPALLALMADPTPVALMEHAVDAQHLTPAAERWYWRTHLLAALDAPWDHPDDLQTRDLVHSTTYWLRPNPCAVREGRTDYDDAQNLRERCSPAQREAISEFLGYILTSPLFAGTIYAYGTSQSIAWCWSDHPETARAADALREEARSYVRAPADTSLDEGLFQAIERAFADTPYPVGPLMSAGDEEPSSYAIELRDTRWQALAPWFLDDQSAAFSFMTPAAFRYFLPAAMCHALGPGTEVNLDFHLVTTLLQPSRYRDAVRARVTTFSAEERRVVADFLRADWHWGMDPCPEREAAAELWDPDGGRGLG